MTKLNAVYQKLYTQLTECKYRVEGYISDYGIASPLAEAGIAEYELLDAEIEKVINAMLGHEGPNGYRASEAEYWAMVDKGAIDRNSNGERFYATNEDECQAMVDAAIARNHYDEA